MGWIHGLLWWLLILEYCKRNEASSVHKPNLSPCASWSSVGISVINSTSANQNFSNAFIDINDKLYIADQGNKQIQIVSEKTGASQNTMTVNLTFSSGLFVTKTGDIYLDHGNHSQVSKRPINTEQSTTVMYVNRGCTSLFVSINQILYCAINNGHLVIKMPLDTGSVELLAVAGTGCPGSALNMLNQPSGIYVDINMDLYVADTGNNRIQLFRSGQLDGTTVAGADSSLSLPTSVILDGNNSLFIVDSGNKRIVRSTPNGLECIIGCSNSPCSNPDVSCQPLNAIFSRTGDIYVTNANGIEKYTLATNSCVSTTSTTTPPATTTTTTTITTTTTTIQSTTCFAPQITLFPQSSGEDVPVQFRRGQDFYISAMINIKCLDSPLIEMKWSIFNCTLNCSMKADINPSIATTFSEIFFPEKSLPYGLYQMKLTVTMAKVPSIMSYESTFVKINPSGITANLVKYGTSFVTSGEEKNLTLNPGIYSINPDESEFNASDWTYEYACKPHSTIGNEVSSNFNQTNHSCFAYRSDNTPAWQYDSTNGSQSSVTIFGGSLKANRTYRFAVFMINRRNLTKQATGYVFVKVEITRPQMIVIDCIISTMCDPTLEVQYINPITQVALLSECAETCRPLLNIHWNIYEGYNDTNTNIINWHRFNSNFYSFGMNTSRFTALNSLFLNNSQIYFWRFEVVYTFVEENSSSALDFKINEPPENGTCSIRPSYGDTSTLFQINCTGWIDSDDIEDYSFYIGTTSSEQQMLAFTKFETLFIQLPAGYGNQSVVNLIVHVRDKRNCVRKHPMEPVTVVTDQVAIDGFINAVDNIGNGSMNNVMIHVLASGNQNRVGQIVNLISQELNERNEQDSRMAVQSGTPIASISVSALGSEMVTAVTNGSISPEYKRKLNRLATVRDYLIDVATKLTIVNIDSAKLQASTLAQLTAATNELTRSGSMRAAKKCNELAQYLYKNVRRIPYEDAVFATNQIAQCVNQLLIAVNAPLGSRSVLLDAPKDGEDIDRDDYDSDYEPIQLTLESLDNGNDAKDDRMRYYQRKAANQVTKLAMETFSLISSILNIHLNIGQKTTINSPSLFVSLETVKFESLFNRSIEPVGNIQIRIPLNPRSDLSKNESISLRSTAHSLASYGASPSQATTNMSTMISLTVLDENGMERSIQASENEPIEFFIPREPNLIFPAMTPQNATSKSSEEPFLVDLNQFLVNRNLTVSLHFEIRPDDTSLGYLFIYRFDKQPKWNSGKYEMDGWVLFCPENLSITDNTYTYYIDNRQTAGRTALIFKLRELISTEVQVVCQSQSRDRPPIFDEAVNFTSEYHLRIYSSGCYYLDQNNNWQSDGLWVGRLTDHHRTYCFSTHLTSFASGFLPLSIKTDENQRDRLEWMKESTRLTHPTCTLESLYRTQNANSTMCNTQFDHF